MTEDQQEAQAIARAITRAAQATFRAAETRHRDRIALLPEHSGERAVALHLAEIFAALAADVGEVK